MPNLFSIEPEALNYIEQHTKGNNWYFRIRVINSGCAGFKYDFSFDTISNEDDQIFYYDGVYIITDNMSLSFLRDSTITLREGIDWTGLEITNEKQKKCRCGFSVEGDL